MTQQASRVIVVVIAHLAARAPQLMLPDRPILRPSVTAPPLERNAPGDERRQFDLRCHRHSPAVCDCLRAKRQADINKSFFLLWPGFGAGLSDKNLFVIGQVVHAHVPLSPSSIIRYRSQAVTLCGWEGNRRSGIAVAVRHRLKWYIYLRSLYGLKV